MAFNPFSKFLTVSLYLIVTLQFGHSMEPNFSLCSDYFYNVCINGLAYDDCTFADIHPTGASVKGLWVLFNTGRLDGPDQPGLAEFLFQERVGDYHLLTETSGNLTCVKRMGGEDYRAPAITLVKELELIHDSVVRLYETAGSPDSCGITHPTSTKSLAINGAERWELVGSSGTSVCIQVENTTSFIPAIVRDIRALGFGHEEGNICAVIRGCSKAPEEVVRIPNTETFGVLRR